MVWESLADIARWPEWSVIYPKADGVLRIESALTLELALPGRPARTINPVILDWVPDDQIHWRDKMMGGLVTSVRYLEIEKLSDTGCIFSNGEIFKGFGLRWFPVKLRKSLRAGFAALGESMQARSEALWRERSGGAT